MQEGNIQRDNQGPDVSADLARANAEAAELLAELEEKSQRLRISNESLANVNVEAAELVAELEEKNELLGTSNENLARANVRSAELVAELQSRREELEWANTGLKQANEETKRILGIAAHDLRSGLSGILGFSELQYDEMDTSDPELREQTKMIRDESRRLLDLLESLLNESCSRMGKSECKATRVDFNELIEGAVQIQSNAATQKGQQLSVRTTGDDLSIEADPVRVRQVLDNLLSNAIKYSPPGSSILIDVLCDDENVGLNILDQGPGLTEEDLKKVFGEFVQLSAKPTAGEDSHGLGLSIAKKIVEQHDGRIWAENRTDRPGANFGFLLTRSVTTSQNCRILVVDDEVLNRKLAGKLLEKAGHTVDLCKDGLEALEAIKDNEYQLVLMDVEMPEMSGLEVARAVRAMGKDEEHLPIIAVTGHTDPAHLSECLAASMNDTVTKPVNSEILKTLLNTWIRRPCSRHQST